MIDTACSSSLPLDAVFRRACGFFPAPVAMLITNDAVMTVSSIQWVSQRPPLISFAIARGSQKGAAILNSGRFHARLLRNDEEGFAKSGVSPSGPGLVELACSIVSVSAAGDHDLAIAEVYEVSVSEGRPLVYWRRALHHLRPHYEFLASAQTFEAFVAAWEAGTLPKAQWSHAAHVAVSAYYLVRYPGAALERMRTGILRYNEATGTPNSDTVGYHETLTQLWISVVERIVTTFTCPWEAACFATERLGEERDLHYLYYSFDVVRSVEARRTWVPPDLNGPLGGFTSLAP